MMSTLWDVSAAMTSFYKNNNCKNEQSTQIMDMQTRGQCSFRGISGMCTPCKHGL